MKQVTMLILALFGGLVIAVLVLGFHKSGPARGTASGNPGNPVNTPTYPTTATWDHQTVNVTSTNI